ncbi:MAG: hypothetical protein ACI8UO_005621 [Verrucomicrobiales bacterium]
MKFGEIQAEGMRAAFDVRFASWHNDKGRGEMMRAVGDENIGVFSQLPQFSQERKVPHPRSLIEGRIMQIVAQVTPPLKPAKPATAE